MISTFVILYGFLATFLLAYKLVDFKYNYHLAFSCVGLAVLTMALYHANLAEWGITTITAKMLTAYVAIAIVSSVLIVINYKYLLKVGPLILKGNTSFKIKFLGYALVSSCAQEILFRVFPYFVLSRLHALTFFAFMLLSAIIFTVAHTIYRNVSFVVTAAKFGVIAGVIYYFYPNLILIAALHTLLGFWGFYYKFVVDDLELLCKALGMKL
jgi:hypothetical protein